jgi:hypothetical protein
MIGAEADLGAPSSVRLQPRRPGDEESRGSRARARALTTAAEDGTWHHYELFPGTYVVATGEKRYEVIGRAAGTTELDLR